MKSEGWEGGKEEEGSITQICNEAAVERPKLTIYTTCDEIWKGTEG